MRVLTLQEQIREGLGGIDDCAKSPGYDLDVAIENYTRIVDQCESGSDQWIKFSAFLSRCLWHKAHPQSKEADLIDRRVIVKALWAQHDSISGGQWTRYGIRRAIETVETI